MIDDRTDNLGLPLPNAENLLSQDVARLRAALIGFDAALPLKADLVGGKVPASQLPPIFEDTDDIPEGAGNLYFTDARARAAQQAATTSAVGVVRVGAGLAVAANGLLSVNLPFSSLTNKPTTVAGYGLTDAATVTQLGTKANTSDMNTALAAKANTADVNTSLAAKANTADVNSALALKADASDLNEREPQLSVVTTAANIAAENGKHYIATAVSITITAPASPTDGFRFGFTNTQTGTILVNWSGKAVKGVLPNPQSMVIPSRGSAIVRWSAVANTWVNL